MSESDHRVVLPLKQAKRIGHPFYYAAKPCKHGHWGERRVKGGCVECQRKTSRVKRGVDWKSMRVSASKANAKRRGLDHSVCADDLYWPDVCPVLGIRLSYNSDRSDDSSAEIDRLDSTKGYVKGNVYIISRRANRIKSDASTEELKKILRFMEDRNEHRNT